MFRFRRRYVGARHIAQRLGVSVEIFLSLYSKPVWRVPRPRVIRDRARWDMVEVEYWLDTLALVQPPSFKDWLVINGHRVAPYTAGWSLLEALRPRWWPARLLTAPPRPPEGPLWALLPDPEALDACPACVRRGRHAD